MWTTNTLTCMVKGHVFRRVTHDNSLYHYCLRCGKVVWEHTHVTSYRHEMRAALAGGETVARAVQDSAQLV